MQNLVARYVPMTIPEEKRAGYISLKEASERFGYSQDYLGQLIRKGKLDGKLVYSHVAWVTTPEAIEEYIETNKDKKRKNKLKEAIEDTDFVTEENFREVRVQESGETIDADPMHSEAAHEADAPPHQLAKWLIVLFRVLLFAVIIFAIFVFYLLTTAFGEEVKVTSRVAHASQTFSLSLHANDHE